MITTAETCTLAPASTSTIINPLETSLTDRASSAYLRGDNHCSQRRTPGIRERLMKNPANAIWNRLILQARVDLRQWKVRVAKRKETLHRGNQNCDSCVWNDRGEQEVEQSHGDRVENQDQQKLEEVFCVSRQSDHPTSREKRSQISFSDSESISSKPLTRQWPLIWSSELS